MKVVKSVEEAAHGIEDGAFIAVSGFGLCGNPESLISIVADRGIRNLTLISNNSGNLGKGLATWLKAGLIRKVICSYIGNNMDLHSQMANKSVEVEVIPQGTMVERLRSGGAGIAGFYTRTGVGTVVEEGKETKVFDGETYLLERAIKPDFAFVRARKADAYGNLRFWRTAQNFGPVMAMASKVAIAECDELVEVGALDPDDVHLPGIFIQRVVEVTSHEDPFEYLMEQPA